MPFSRNTRIKRENPGGKTFLHRVAYPERVRENSESVLPDDQAISQLKNGTLPSGALAKDAPVDNPQPELQQTLFKQSEKQPDNPNLLVLLGWSSADALRAASYFRRALSLEPDNPVAHDGLQWAVSKLSPSEVEQLDRLSVEAATPDTIKPVAREMMLHKSTGTARILGSRSGFRDFRWQTLSRFYQIPFFRNLSIAILYLLLISSAEIVTVLADPAAGIIFHAFIMIALIIHGSIIQQGPFRRYLIALALAPLIRLLSLSLPLAMLDIPVIYRYLIVGVPLLLAVYFSARSVGLTTNRLYFTWKGWQFQLLFSLTGLILGTCEYFILRPQALVTSAGWFDILMGALILFVFTGFLEELIFRGLLQVTGVQLFGGTAIWIISFLFGILHIGYYSIFDVVFATVVGMLFGFAALKTRSLLGVSLAHGFTNVMLYIFLPLVIGK